MIVNLEKCRDVHEKANILSATRGGSARDIRRRHRNRTKPGAFERIFEPLARERKRTPEGGTGLGLTVTRG